ncbi:MAG: metalloregulator ArsR/SmtB family transcription factor [Oscillospiraceae bacterium]|nr:metalloregulator ArsR/SmtB family transcription factor [Oscillospiraceae bacterium]
MARYHDNARVFMAFSDITRLKILDFLQGDEMTATELQEKIKIGQSTLSHHMKILVESGVVTARKAKKWTYYSISESGGRYAAGLVKLLTTKSTATEANIKHVSSKGKRRTRMTKTFSIITDTSCDLPREYLEENDIEVLPVPFTLNGTVHSMGYWQEVSDKDFYDALRNGGTSKTSQINPDTFTESFVKYAERGEDALYIILSGALSATYQSSLIALDDVNALYPDCNIYPVDGICATTINAVLVKLAVQKRSEGLSAEETAAILEEKKHQILGFFTVDDLMFLHRGGRLSKLSAIGGSIIGIKPILSIQPDGSLALKGKARGREAALKQLVTQLTQGLDSNAAVDTVYISHSDSEKDALTLAEMVKAAVWVNNVELITLGPVIGSHVGPGAITLVFESHMTRREYENKYHPAK